MQLKVKWGKERYEVEVDPSKPVAELKAELFKRTGVPLDRQKLLSKAWRGMLKDDTDLSTVKLRAGLAVTLMGSSAGVPTATEDDKVVFVEDMKQEERAAAGAVAPSGFVNLGNTCFMNSTTQVLRAVPELRDALAGAEREGFAGGRGMAVQLGRAFRGADGTRKQYMPSAFLSALHRMHPNFAERGKTGQLMQHDCDEYLTTVMEDLAQDLTENKGKAGPVLPSLVGRVNHDPSQAGSSVPNVVDTVFGVEFKVTDTNTVDPTEVTTSFESNRKLVCNIDGGAGSYKPVNHLTDGVELALNGQREKTSAKLGSTVVWDTKRRISRLPKVLGVQFMRFYFKATPDSADHAGVKCKMLRKVAFSEKMDVFDWCTPEVQAVLKVARDKAEADEAKKLAESTGGGSGAVAGAAGGSGEGDADGDVTLPAPDAPGLGAEVSELDADLAAALAMSEQGADVMEADDAAVAAGADPQSSIGVGLPDAFQGHYELFAVVTHKGRSADSGHYMGWIRGEGDAWFVFDDDEVQACELEHVLQLHGGGDRDMAYLVFYRAKQ